MSTSKSSQQTPGGLRPARRSVVKGAAWAVPAVVVASAAPAMAGSPPPRPPRPRVVFSGAACKLPGNSQDIFKGYRFQLNVTNQASQPILIVIDSVRVGGVTEPAFAATPADGDECSCLTCASKDPTGTKSVCVEANTAAKIFVDTANPSGTSSNTEFSITYSAYLCDEPCTTIVTGQVLSSGLLSTPPIQGGQCTLCSGAACDDVPA